MKIMLDKERDFNLTIRGVIEYEKLGYGKVSEITDKSSSKLIGLSHKLGKDGLSEFLALRKDIEAEKKGDDKFDDPKFQTKLMYFFAKYDLDMGGIRESLPYENAVVLFRLGLGLKTDNEVYDILEKAVENKESDITADNFNDIVYKLLLVSKAVDLEKNAEKTVPLQ